MEQRAYRVTACRVLLLLSIATLACARTNMELDNAVMDLEKLKAKRAQLVEKLKQQDAKAAAKYEISRPLIKTGYVKVVADNDMPKQVAKKPLIESNYKKVETKKFRVDNKKTLAANSTNDNCKMLEATIDLSEQKMKVYKGATLLYEWKVSTARRGYVTPTGNYKPYYLTTMHYSRKYDNSPMPHAIFFRGGYAIHGTDAVWRLGKRASHGCVRLHPQNAKMLYALVQKYGKDNTSIRIIH